MEALFGDDLEPFLWYTRPDSIQPLLNVCKQLIPVGFGIMHNKHTVVFVWVAYQVVDFVGRVL